MVFEIRFKLQHTCPFLELTKLFGDKISYGYCCRSYDVLSLPTDEDPNKLRKFAKEKGFPNTENWRISSIKDHVLFVQMSCLCDSMYDKPITGLLQDKGGLIKYPISYENGWEYYNVLAFDKSVHKEVIAEIERLNQDKSITIEITSINELGVKGLFQSQMVSVPELFDQITPHQLDILMRAFEKGYYQIPRGVRTKDIAETLDMSRYGVDKVLRTAENNIMRNLAPYLYFKQYLESEEKLQSETN